VLLGGLLTSALSWHWSFSSTCRSAPRSTRSAGPCCLEGAAGEQAAPDIAGAVTVTASLMLAVYAIVNGNQAGWSGAQTLGLLAAAAVLLALFLGIEARVRAPLMPLGLFRLRSVATANVVGVLWGAAMFAWFFISRSICSSSWAIARCKWPRVSAGQT